MSNNIKLYEFSEKSTIVDFSYSMNQNILSIYFDVASNISDFPTTSTNKVLSFKDNLWQNTCFEIFIKSAESSNYIEWNFSPEGHYAVYYFEDIRKKLDISTCKAEFAPLSLSYNVKDQVFFKADLDLNVHESFLRAFENGMIIKPCFIAVNQKGETLYFAPAHTKETPDFHDFSEGTHELKKD